MDFTKIKDKRAAGKCFDYAILPKQTTEEEIRMHCRKAIEYNCKAFCFSSDYWTTVVKEELEGTDLLIGAAIGFPFGQQTNETKCFETENAVRLGATVLDCCMNVGDLKDKKYAKVLQDFKDYVAAAQGVMTKMIIETCYLTPEEIKIASELVAESGIDWVKSSSGQYVGTTLEECLIMSDAVKGTNCKVKVSGVKFPRPQNAYQFLLYGGADLIGTRSAPEILDQFDLYREIGMIPAYEG